MHYIITLFNLIYPTLLQLQITIKLKTIHISLFTKKNTFSKLNEQNFKYFSHETRRVCIRWREEEKSTVQYRKPRGSRVVCKLRLGTRLCFTPRDLSDDSDEETTILEETKAKERERERKGNRRTRDERFFLRFSSADLPPPPPGWMDTAQESLLSVLRSSTFHFRRATHTSSHVSPI